MGKRGELKLTLGNVCEWVRDRGAYFRQIGISNQYRLFTRDGEALGYFTVTTYNSFVMNYANKIERITVNGMPRTQWKARP